MGNVKFIDIDSDETLLKLLSGVTTPCSVPKPRSYRTGELLCVREPWALISLEVGYEYTGPVVEDLKNFHLTYRAGASDFEESLISRWREPSEAPEGASRMTVEVIAISYYSIAVRLWKT